MALICLTPKMISVRWCCPCSKLLGYGWGFWNFLTPNYHLYRSRKLTFWIQIDEGLVQIPDDFPVFKHRWSSASCRPFFLGEYLFIDSVIRLQYPLQLAVRFATHPFRSLGKRCDQCPVSGRGTGGVLWRWNGYLDIRYLQGDMDK